MDRYCFHCQFIVNSKGNDTPQDKQAKLRGYCSDVCRQLTAGENDTSSWKGRRQGD